MTFVSSEPPKKKLPPPFKRPRIELSGAGREWQWILPKHLKENDIVPDMGLINSVKIWKRADSPEFIAVVDSANGIHKLENDKEVWAFTRKPT